MARIMALDVGTKTCGVALSDPMGWTAQPHTTLRYAGEHDMSIFENLYALFGEKEVATVVIGLPLNMNGTEGPQAEKVRFFIHRLQKFMARQELDPNTINWIYRDERLSSTGAERTLLEADLSRSKRKQVIDKMAAVFILQGYLEELENQKF